MQLSMKPLKYLLLFAIVFASTGCSVVALTGRKQLLLVPETQILAMSAQSYTEFINQAALSTDKANSEMVQRVGSRISQAVQTYMQSQGLEAQIADYKWEYNLVKSQEVNAFCMPGGKIVVYEGILPVTQTETGLAVVIGHEIAHAVARHGSERVSQQLMLAVGGAVISAFSDKASEDAKAVIGMLYGLGGTMGTLKYSRNREYEADRMGLIFMSMAGYDPSQAAAFWQRMSEGSSSGFEFLSTHPVGANRVKYIQKCLPEALGYSGSNFKNVKTIHYIF